MNKAVLWVQGMWHCISWMVHAIWKETMVDLDFAKIPWHPQDFIWYAERWNGRLAMIGITIVLYLEFVRKTSLLDLFHVL